MSNYEHTDKQIGNGLAIQDWNNLSSAIGGASGLGLARNAAHNVGIGTAAPETKLDVHGRITARSNGGAVDLVGNDHAYIQLYPQGRHGQATDRKGWIGYGHAGSQDLKIHSNAGELALAAKTRVHVLTGMAVDGALTAASFAGDGSRLTNLSVGLNGLNLATQSGHVGIGTASPTHKLDVAGSLRVKGNAGVMDIEGRDHAYIQMYPTGGDRLGYIGFGGAGTKNMTVQSQEGAVVLETKSGVSISGDGKEAGPDRAMHISSDCILFGGNNNGKETNSAQISAGKHVPDELNIVGMASGSGAGDRKIRLWAEGGLTVHGSNNTWTVKMDNKQLYFSLATSHHGGTSSRTMYWNGDSNWDGESDARLKTNIEPEEQILPRLLQLPVKRYQWIDGGGEDPHKIGFVAQDVKPLFPELVGAVTKPGEDEETLTLKYASFGVLAIGGLRELKAQTDAVIAEQRGVIERLQARLARLEGQLAGA